MNDSLPINAVKSADRALAIIDLVAGKGFVSFTEILSSLGLPRSSAYGLLNTLHAAGWLDHDDSTRQYSLGLRAWQVGQMYTGHQDLAKAAQPVLDRLAASLDETVQLSRMDGVDNVYVAISQHSRTGMVSGSPVGMRLLAHATGTGKALLSNLEPAEVERRLRAVALTRLTEKTITEVPLLLGQVAEAKARGYALDDQESRAGHRCVAVPLTGETGGINAAISVGMPIARTSEQWPDDILRPLAGAAHEIRARLGASEHRIAAPQF